MNVRYWMALALLVGAVAYYGHARDLRGRLAAYHEREQSVNELRDQLAEKENQKASLERRVQDLESDPVEIEAAIREAEKKVREGETIYRLERGGVATTTAPIAP